ARALRMELSGNEKQALDEIPTDNLAAYDAYVAGRSSMQVLSDENYSRALEQFSLATELDPEFAAAWAGLCTTHLSMYARDSDRSHFESAEAACERALELDDTRAEVYVALGTLYSYSGQYAKAEVALQRASYSKAEAALEQALEMDGVELEALFELGHVLAMQGRLTEAEQYLQRAASLEPGSWEAQTHLFSFYYSFSDRPDRFELAVQHAAKSTSLRDDLAASWNNLGAANYFLGRFDLAADAWEESLNIEPNRTAYTNTGLALYFSGKFEEAAAMQEKAIELAPNDHRAMGRLGDALHFVPGEEEQSLLAYRKAAELAEALLEVNDRDWRTLAHLATYVGALGEEDRAAELIARALQLSERNAETLYGQAIVHLASDRPEKALDVLAEAVGKDPDYRTLIGNEPYFEPLRALPAYASLFSAG
ncbi:MAG: tetratricopeptide repeat protein, partial [Xanthomonadales bacterium]|nr:tetratricopeptide repeat protein [Xanthomonadales bacterium]